MGITVRTQIKDDYVLVNCRGTFAKDDLLEAAEKSLELATQNNLKKILFVASELEGNPPTTMERFEMSEAFVEMQNRRKVMVKCAFVGKEPILDPERFSKTVIVNRGYDFEVFTDITAAVNWLKE